jgi:fatty acid amide hydrolase
MWNILEYPAGTVPISTVNADEQTYVCDLKDSMSTAASASLKGSEGLPLGIQVISLPFEDEIVLRLLKEIEQKANFYEKNKPILTMNKIL